MDSNKALAVFRGKNIRKTWFNDEWYYSVVDIVAILTESSNSRRYWSDLKIKLKEEGVELYGFIVQLKLFSTDDKSYLTDCINTKKAFRLIQSIPSKNAEPFKLWLAKTGYERVQEIDNPELAQERMKSLYEQKGYSKEWINKRLRGIAVRQELTGEWENRGVSKPVEYAILTNEISSATFGKTVEEYKKFKELNNQNLRDHMDDIELILTMLGEATTSRLTKERDSLQFPQLKKDAHDGGDVAGATRKDIENKLGKSIISERNYLKETEKKKRLELKKND